MPYFFNRLLAALVLISAIPLAAPRALRADQPTSTPLNFVFFLVDDLGWKDLGCDDNSFHETLRSEVPLAREEGCVAGLRGPGLS